MKKFRDLLLLGMMILALVSCGKEEQSSGGGGSSGSSGSGSTSGVNYKNHSELKKAFTSKSFTTGLSDKTVIYHVGPDFGGTNFNSIDIDFDFDFGFCGNFFGKTYGDCDSYSNNGVDYDNLVEKGEYKRVIKRSKDKIEYDLATGAHASGTGAEFTRKSYTRGDSFYREMLNLDKKSVQKVVISKAEVYVTNASTGKRSTIKADYVEYFFNDSERSLKGYVVSNQLPLFANPLAITTGRNLSGALSNSGNTIINYIRVQMHDLQLNQLNYKYIQSNYGPIRTFNINQQY